MKTMTLHLNGFTARWRGGAFIAVWRAERNNQHVPDFMIPVPEGINRSRATDDQIKAATESWLEANSIELA